MRAVKALLAFATVLVLAAPATAELGLPTPATERGHIIADTYVKITIAGIAMFVLVMIILIVVLVRFRETSGHGRTTHEKERHSTAAEVGWLVGPLILVLWIGVISYQGLVKLDSPAAEPVGEVQVVAERYAWTFDYSRMPGGDGVKASITTTNDGHGNYSYSDVFHLPADTPIRLNITSKDVIHAFQIFDGNRAAFSFNDANPLGDHRYTQFTTSFPAGTYLIQCNKFCGNPGHAQMLGKIIVEPKSAYQGWLKHRFEMAGANLLSEIHVTATEAGFTIDGAAPTNITLVTGQRLVVEATNPLATAATFTANGVQYVIAPGATDYFHVDFPGAGGFALTSGTSGRLDVHVIDATPIQVTLEEYKITPTDVQFVKGQTYLVQVTNKGASLHNFYIGHYRDQKIAFSQNIAGGSTGSFTWTPTESGVFDTWCDVPGHADLGMKQHAHVA